MIDAIIGIDGKKLCAIARKYLKQNVSEGHLLNAILQAIAE